jgi:hypothetical protein
MEHSEWQGRAPSALILEDVSGSLLRRFRDYLQGAHLFGRLPGTLCSLSREAQSGPSDTRVVMRDFYIGQIVQSTRLRASISSVANCGPEIIPNMSGCGYKIGRWDAIPETSKMNNLQSIAVTSQWVVDKGGTWGACLWID